METKLLDFNELAYVALIHKYNRTISNKSCKFCFKYTKYITSLYPVSLFTRQWQLDEAELYDIRHYSITGVTENCISEQKEIRSVCTGLKNQADKRNRRIHFSTHV